MFRNFLRPQGGPKMEKTLRLTMLCAAVALLCFAVTLTTGFAQDKFFDSNGVRIRYVEQGNGDAILLIHNFGNNLDRWIASGVLPNLARDYRVIAFDVRGHGKSGKPQDVKLTPVRHSRIDSVIRRIGNIYSLRRNGTHVGR